MTSTAERPLLAPLPKRGSHDDQRLRALFMRWQQHGDQAAREQLVRRYLPLARKLAQRYHSSNEPLEDLVQVASLGLVLAIDRFDLEAGTAFSSYAVPTILGELRRHFRDHGWNVHVPRRAKERALKVEQALKQMSAGATRDPSPQMIAEYLEWPLEHVLEGLEARGGHHGISLNAPAREDDDTSDEMIDTVGETDEAFAMVDARLNFAEALRHLPLQTRQVVAMRFAGELTQAQIGERLGISQMQVSRLLRGAIAEVRRCAV